MAAVSQIRRFRLPLPFDLTATLSSVAGPGGETSRRRAGVYWKATRNDGGAVTVAIRREGPNAIAEAWGPGAGAELDMLPRLLGVDDDPESFDPPAGLVAELARRNQGMRLGSTGRMFEALAPTVLGQRVTSGEAHQAFNGLVRSYGEPAPGPTDLKLPPAPASLAVLTYEELHRHGIERSRAAILVEIARRERRLEEAATMSRPDAYTRLTAIRGIGPWTAGHVMGIAWGDRDAVPIGDFHLPNTVAWALAGEPRADDARMLELLDPYRPHRRRVVVLLKRAGAAAPRFGPKTPIHNIRGR